MEGLVRKVSGLELQLVTTTQPATQALADLRRRNGLLEAQLGRQMAQQAELYKGADELWRKNSLLKEANAQLREANRVHMVAQRKVKAHS